MPMKKSRYPANWKEIALAVKEAAGWKCQACGKQCRKPGEKLDTHKRTLTVHHIDHRPENSEPENMIALCAPCHLKMEAEHSAEIRKTREKWKGVCFTIEELPATMLPDFGEIQRLGEKMREFIARSEWAYVIPVEELSGWDTAYFEAIHWPPDRIRIPCLECVLPGFRIYGDTVTAIKVYRYMKEYRVFQFRYWLGNYGKTWRCWTSVPEAEQLE